MEPLTSREALDRYFLEARCKLLDVAAILDRIERGSEVPSDPRLEKIRQALGIIQGSGIDRAEKIQQLFSLRYEEGWSKPTPRE